MNYNELKQRFPLDTWSVMRIFISREQALQQTGYQLRQRAFSPKQVEQIFKYLGQP